MAVDDAVCDEVAECPEETLKVDEDKSGWPEQEKDSAPSALLVPAGRCIQRHLKLLEKLRKRFTDAADKSNLQTGFGSQI